MIVTPYLILSICALVAAKDTPPPILSDPKDHHDYGRDPKTGRWHTWDEENTFKPRPCKSVADCHTNPEVPISDDNLCGNPITNDPALVFDDLTTKLGTPNCQGYKDHPDYNTCYCIIKDEAKMQQYMAALWAYWDPSVEVEKTCLAHTPVTNPFAYNAYGLQANLKCKTQECAATYNGTEFPADDTAPYPCP